MADILECPFCDYTETDSYVLILHVEQFHTQNSPFVAREESHGLPSSLLNPQKEASSGTNATKDAAADDAQWVLCPQPDCGEQIHLAELDEHADFHMAEQLTAGDKPASPSGMHYPITTPHSLDHLGNFSTSLPDDLRHGKTRKRSDSEKTSLSRSILDILSPPSSTRSNNSKLKNKFGSTRLGKSELGPYAFEEHMPKWLHKQLEAGPKTTQQTTIGRDGKLVKQEVVENETPAILPILAQLLAADKSVKQAYLCHPSTIHICKTPRAGGFCGYRNIQMLVSYMQGARTQGYEKFPGRTPGILMLQDMIEAAWDKGINQIGRAQTGGIKDTRKYIGTPEVMALFQSLGIDYGVQAFTDRKNDHAYEQLLTDVEIYFKTGAKDGDAKIHKTNLPPIYLQQPGHSISIVGFERYKDGSRDMLVFDPMFSTSPGMCRLLGRKDIRTSRPEVLQAYRRDSRQLKKHRDFEIVKLTADPSLFPTWEILEAFSDCPFVYAFLNLEKSNFEIIPEDYFRPFFPWMEYGRLFSVANARFSSSAASAEVFGQSREHAVLAGLPSMQDESHKNWLKCTRTECQEACCKPNPQQPLLHGFAVPHVKMVSHVEIAHSREGSEEHGDPVTPPSSIWSPLSSSASMTAYHSAAAYLSPNFPQSDPEAEDVYFERTSEHSVPVHYGCGNPHGAPEGQHSNDGACVHGKRRRLLRNDTTPTEPPRTSVSQFHDLDIQRDSNAMNQDLRHRLPPSLGTTSPWTLNAHAPSSSSGDGSSSQWLHVDQFAYYNKTLPLGPAANQVAHPPTPDTLSANTPTNPPPTSPPLYAPAPEPLPTPHTLPISISNTTTNPPPNLPPPPSLNTRTQCGGGSNDRLPRRNDRRARHSNDYYLERSAEGKTSSVFYGTGVGNEEGGWVFKWRYCGE